MAEFEEFHFKFYGIKLKKIPNKLKFMIEFKFVFWEIYQRKVKID